MLVSVMVPVFNTQNYVSPVVRPGRVADHSPPTSAQVKKCVELYLHPPIRRHGVMLS